jgi:hypothetical protein
MGEIKVGDLACTPDGLTAPVIGVFPQGKKEVYRIFFKDGSFTECCKEHLWLVESIYNKWNDGKRVLDTEYLFKNFQAKNRCRFAVPVTQPVYFNYIKIEINPYVMGVLLGDGNFTNKNSLRFSTVDKKILNSVNKNIIPGCKITRSKSKKCDYRISKIKKDNKPTNYVIILKKYNLWGLYSYQKFVPDDYLFNTVENRFALLCGLMDTDGHVSKKGNIRFYSTSKKLAENVKFLVESLGGLGKITQKQTMFTYKKKKKLGKLCYVCSIKMDNAVNIFTLKRKQKRIVERTKYFAKRIINNIEPIGIKDTQCILLNTKDHLYLTNDFIVTHNTELARRHAAANKLPLVEISPKSIKSVHDIFKEISKVCDEFPPPQGPLTLREVIRENHYIPPPINVFIDEVHALSTSVVQGLLKATEPKDAILVTERGITVDCKNIHWMIATTDRGKLFDAFDTRFTKCILNLYTKEEVAQVVQTQNPDWELSICRLVAHYCGRIPREALAFAREMQLEFNMNPNLHWPQVASRVAEDNEIDELGMTYKRRDILAALGQGPISEKRLAIIACVKAEELEKFIMPWLLANTDEGSLVNVSRSGYTITEAGLKELNIRKIPHKGMEAIAA